MNLSLSYPSHSATVSGSQVTGILVQEMLLFCSFLVFLCDLLISSPLLNQELIDTKETCWYVS